METIIEPTPQQEEEFFSKLAKGHVFEHRYIINWGKVSSLASGDNPEEAIVDARRCYKRAGMASMCDGPPISIELM